MANFLERLQIIIDADAKGAITGFGKSAAAAQEAEKANTSFAAGAKRAALGVGIIGVAAFGAAASFANLGVKIQQFKDVTGVSAKVASQWVAILDDYGISADVGAKAVRFLSDEASKGGTKLAQFGVEVAKNRDGSVNLQGTLLNVAEAYKHAGSAAEANGILTAAFGKRISTQLIPILKQGREGIEKMFAAVPSKQIFSDEDLKKARAFKLALDNLEDAFRELVLALGSVAAGPLTDFMNGIAELVRGLGDMDQALGTSAVSATALGAGMGYLIGGPIGALVGGIYGIGTAAADVFSRGFPEGVDLTNVALQKNYEVLGHAKVGSDEYNKALQFLKENQSASAAAAKDAAAGQDRFAAATATATQNATDLTNAIFGLISADLAAQGSALAVEAATNAYNESLAKNGASALATREAQNRLEIAIVQAATAAGKAAAEALPAQATAQDRAKASADAARQTFIFLASQLDGPTRAAVQKYIDELTAIPPAKHTNITTTAAQAWAGVRQLNNEINSLHDKSVVMTVIRRSFGGFFQSGGPVPGSPNTPVPAVLHGGEYVLSADVVSRIKQGRPSEGAQMGGGSSRSGGAGGSYNITVNAGMGANGGQIGKAIIEVIQKYERQNGTGWRN